MAVNPGSGKGWMNGGVDAELRLLWIIFEVEIYGPDS